MKKKSKKAKNQTKTKRKKEKREQLFTVISNGVEGKAVAQDVFPAWKRCTVWGFLQLIVPQMCQREQGLPLWPLLWVFGDSAEGDSDPGATSLCPALKGFQSWNPKAKLCSPTGSELTLPAWIAIKKPPKKPWANFAKRGHNFYVNPAWCSHPWGRALRVWQIVKYLDITALNCSL